MREGEIYVVLGLFMLVGIIQKPIVVSYFNVKGAITSPGFGDIVTRDRSELICKLLHLVTVKPSEISKDQRNFS
jgi:hypothetical protein